MEIMDITDITDITKWLTPKDQSDPQLSNMIDQETQLSYNYYPTFATKLQPSYTGYIHYSFQGKENEPNLIINQRQISTKFVSKNLFIFSKIHNFLPTMADQQFDAELVIEHAPITNGDRPIYVCFPLKSDPSAPKNILYKLLDPTDESSVSNLDINLNPILPLDGLAGYYDTPYSSIIVVQTPISVPANFVGLNRGKIEDLWTRPTTPLKMVRITTSTIFIHKPSPDATPFASPSPAPKRIVEGMEASTNTNDAVVLDCNYSDADIQSEIPVYMVSQKKDEITAKEKTLNQTTSILWSFFIAACAFFIIPVLFGFFGRTIVDNSNSDLSNLNQLEAFIGQLLAIPAILLITIGTSNFYKCKDDDVDCIEQSNGVVYSGVVMAGITMVYIVTMAFKKYTSPNFIGYRDANQTVPYFTYKPEDISFWHYLNPLAFFIVGQIIKSWI